MRILVALTAAIGLSSVSALPYAETTGTVVEATRPVESHALLARRSRFGRSHAVQLAILTANAILASVASFFYVGEFKREVDKNKVLRQKLTNTQLAWNAFLEVAVRLDETERRAVQEELIKDLRAQRTCPMLWLHVWW